MKAATTTPWLEPLPIRLQNGTFVVQPPAGQDPIPPITDTFEQHVNSIRWSHSQIRRRSPEVRRALANHLRHEHHPQISAQGPWIPQDDRHTPFRSVLTPCSHTRSGAITRSSPHPAPSTCSGHWSLATPMP